jgi:hypothetical protein
MAIGKRQVATGLSLIGLLAPLESLGVPFKIDEIPVTLGG